MSQERGNSQGLSAEDIDALLRNSLQQLVGAQGSHQQPSPPDELRTNAQGLALRQQLAGPFSGSLLLQVTHSLSGVPLCPLCVRDCCPRWSYTCIGQPHAATPALCAGCSEPHAAPEHPAAAVAAARGCDGCCCRPASCQDGSAATGSPSAWQQCSFGSCNATAGTAAPTARA